MNADFDRREGPKDQGGQGCGSLTHAWRGRSICLPPSCAGYTSKDFEFNAHQLNFFVSDSNL